ncbi:MAG: transglycosylase SLT domain-containing protein [Patescibacteria group bacterium]
MRVIFKYLFFLILFLGLTATVWTLSYRAGKVLSLASTPSPSPTSSATPTPTPSPSPTPTPTPTPSPTPKPSPTPPQPPPVTPEQIHAFIERFAAQYVVSVHVLRGLAVCESGFNPLAQNAEYAGRYQFDPTTWKNLSLQIGEDPASSLRFNAEEAVQTAAFALSQGKSSIWPNCP